MSPLKKISEKNTKQEILDAYYQSLAVVEGEPIAQSDPKRANETDMVLEKVGEIKQEISRYLDEASGRLLLDLDAIEQSRNSLVKEKRRLLDYYRDQGNLLEDEMNKIKEKWRNEQISHEQLMAEENEQIKTQRKRENEEYCYNLGIERRKEKDGYQQKREITEKDVAEREKLLKDREQEITVMEQDLAAIPAQIDNAVKQAKEDLSNELLGKHTAELKEIKLVHEHETKITELKIAGLTAEIQTLKSEIESSKRQSNEYSKQLKEMAVSVIENRPTKITAPDTAKV